MTATGEEWTEQDEKLYVELRRKHDRIYAKLRRDKKRVYPYIPHRRVSAPRTIKAVVKAEKFAGKPAPVVKPKPAPSPAGLRKCMVCHKPAESLDVRGRCPKCR